MITLKIGTVICPACDVKNSNRVFCWQVANWQLWGSSLLKIKIEWKQKLDSFLFKEKVTLKHLKIIRSSQQESNFKSDCWFYKWSSVMFQKKWEPWCEKRKTSSGGKSCELHEKCSLLEINCSLWIYTGANNKLLRFSWWIYMVLK